MGFSTDYKMVGVAMNLILLTAQQCLTAPCVQQPPTDRSSIVTVTPEPRVTENVSELGIGYLQNLRTGLDILRSIAKSKVANSLHIPDDRKDILEDFGNATNSTGLNFALLTMCNINNVLLQLWEVVPEAIDSNFTLIRTTTRALLISGCEWVNAKYETEFPNSTFKLSCAYPEISSLCLDLDTIMFTDKVDQQLSKFHDTMVNSERWIAENIQRDEVLPDVYDVITKQ